MAICKIVRFICFALIFSPLPFSAGADENAEDMPQQDAVARGGARGYTPVTWCVERLPASIRTVGPEELVWRIRMKHDPEQTRKLIQDWPVEKLRTTTVTGRPG